MKSISIFLIVFSAFVASCDPSDKKPVQKVVTFSGRIINTDNESLPESEISVNGVLVKADKKGSFKISVDSTARYIVSVRKPGYGFVSKIYYESVLGKTYTLVPSVAVVSSAQQTISVSANPVCITSEINKIDWEGSPMRAVPLVLNSDGKIIDFEFPVSALSEAFAVLNSASICSSSASVTIPANSIVTLSNQPVQGNVRVLITPVNIYLEDGMPGDYSFVNPRNNTEGYMLSMGAAIIELWSENGKQQLKLNESAKAKISITIDPLQQKVSKQIPDSVSFLYYNEKEGLWINEGHAILNKETNSYEAEVNHFSAFNMDVEKTEPGCIRFKQEDLFAPTGTRNAYRVASIDYSQNLKFSISGVVNEPGDCGGLHMLYNLPSTTSAPSTNNICLIFYDNASDPPQPHGIYIVSSPTTYAPNNPRNCSSQYDLCGATTPYLFDLTNSNVMVATKPIVAGDIAGKIKWIFDYTGTGSFVYQIHEADDSIGTPGTFTRITGADVASASDSKEAWNPSAEKEYNNCTIGKWYKIVIPAAPLPGSPTVESDPILIN